MTRPRPARAPVGGPSGIAPWLLAVLLGLSLGACATARSPAPVGPPIEPVVGATETGEASWYGRAHQGRPTSSGEPFDMNKLTAAHPTLPFGSDLLVTNLRNGRSVRVRVNDRGPAVPGRIIDLSHAAAEALGYVQAGLAPVRIQVLSLPR